MLKYTKFYIIIDCMFLLENRYNAFFEEGFAKLDLYLPSLRLGESESFGHNKNSWNLIDGDSLQFEARQLFNDAALFENRRVDSSFTS
jgi:hypothetical protein